MAATNDFFIKTLLTDKVKIQPRMICKNIQTIIHKILVNKFEGICSYHGYIKNSSIKISKISLGQVQAFSLNGDVIYTVSYHAEVCNPSIGSIVKARVVNMNKFGILAECGITVDNRHVPILEIIVAKNTVDIASDIDFASITNGEDLFIEILGKKFELNDKKISIVGKIIQTKDQKNILDADGEMEGGAAIDAIDDELELSEAESEEQEKESEDEESDEESDDESFNEEYFSEEDGAGSDAGSDVDEDI